MHIAVLIFDGLNKLDSFIALGILNRAAKDDWKISIASPEATVISMSGVVVHAQAMLAGASAADAVIVGSGMRTQEVVTDASIMAALRLDPLRQLIGAQCSGALVLGRARPPPRSARLHRPDHRAVGHRGWR